MKLKSWHTKLEREVIKKLKGKARVSYGCDGVINGKPVEVRSVRKDKRFRIQKDVHDLLIRKNGSYVFVNKDKKIKKVKAKAVSSLLGRGKWFKDRKYPHKFLKVKEVF